MFNGLINLYNVCQSITSLLYNQSMIIDRRKYVFLCNVINALLMLAKIYISF